MKKNYLKDEASTYLLQHQNNPVNWMPWSDNAFGLAKEFDLPVIVSIGYAACHWCHVMAHECFEDEEVAKKMNNGFVCVKIDREELPHVDAFYMDALHAMGEQGGWPLTMFTDVNGRPIWGGTYFPKHSKYGRPGFLDVLDAIKKAWDNDQTKIRLNTNILIEHLNNQNLVRKGEPKKSQTFDELLGVLLSIQDHDNGGIRGAPKFPNAPILDCFWSGYESEKSEEAKEAFVRTIYGLCAGGIYDHIGGGLCRYSVDERWLAPHFEKMLYDNAHLLGCLAKAWSVTNDNFFWMRINEVVDWLLREMSVGGAFAASLDADSEGEEGKYYVWQKEEVTKLLGKDADPFCLDYDVTEEGNWESNNIPNLLGKPRESLAGIVEKNQDFRMTLLEAKEKRIPPTRDDKILTEWNGLMIEALADAYGYVRIPKLLELAKKTFGVVVELNEASGTLVRYKPKTDKMFVATAADLASICNAASSIYEQTTDDSYLLFAKKYAEELFEKYSNEDGALFQVPEQYNELPVRTLAFSDDANFSAGSHALRLYRRLFALTNDVRWHKRAEALESAMDAYFSGKSHGNAGFMSAKKWRQNYSVVRIVAEKEDAEKWKKIAEQSGRRVVIVVGSVAELPEEHKNQKNEMPFAIVCQNQTCLPPITDIKKFEEVIG